MNFNSVFLLILLVWITQAPRMSKTKTSIVDYDLSKSASYFKLKKIENSSIKWKIMENPKQFPISNFSDSPLLVAIVFHCNYKQSSDQSHKTSSLLQFWVVKTRKFEEGTRIDFFGCKTGYEFQEIASNRVESKKFLR